jgi:hypothetical protein
MQEGGQQVSSWQLAVGQELAANRMFANIHLRSHALEVCGAAAGWRAVRCAGKHAG